MSTTEETTKPEGNEAISDMDAVIDKVSDEKTESSPLENFPTLSEINSKSQDDTNLNTETVDEVDTADTGTSDHVLSASEDNIKTVDMQSEEERERIAMAAKIAATSMLGGSIPAEEDSKPAELANEAHPDQADQVTASPSTSEEINSSPEAPENETNVFPRQESVASIAVTASFSTAISSPKSEDTIAIDDSQVAQSPDATDSLADPTSAVKVDESEISDDSKIDSLDVAPVAPESEKTDEPDLINLSEVAPPAPVVEPVEQVSLSKSVEEANEPEKLIPQGPAVEPVEQVNNSKSIEETDEPDLLSQPEDISNKAHYSSDEADIATMEIQEKEQNTTHASITHHFDDRREYIPQLNNSGEIEMSQLQPSLLHRARDKVKDDDMASYQRWDDEETGHDDVSELSNGFVHLDSPETRTVAHSDVGGHFSKDGSAASKAEKIKRTRVRVIPLIVCGAFSIIGLLGGIFSQVTCNFASGMKAVGQNNQEFEMRAGLWKYSPIDSVFEGYAYCYGYSDDTSQTSQIFSRLFGILAVCCGGFSVGVLWYYLLMVKTSAFFWKLAIRTALVASLCQCGTFFLFTSQLCSEISCRMGPGGFISLFSSLVWLVMGYHMSHNCPLQAQLEFKVSDVCPFPFWAYFGHKDVTGKTKNDQSLAAMSRYSNVVTSTECSAYTPPSHGSVAV